MSNKIKILVCGDVEGCFNILFDKVEVIQKRSGPFDLLICVGNFFGIDNTEFDRFKNGNIQVPVSTIVLGTNSEDHIALFSEETTDLCKNVQYLGKRGIYTTSNGLKIAYLSGISTSHATKRSHEYNDEDVVALRNVWLNVKSSFRGVDILITSQWPTNVTNRDTNWNTNTSLTSTSYRCAWLATQLSPRYHISGLEGIFFERAPFRIPQADLEIPTRFLGMAKVGNTKKQKWIYALSLTPLDKMTLSELSQKTTDETVCPYDIEDLDYKVLRKRKNSSCERRQYFYDTVYKKNRPENKITKRPIVDFDQSKCWFCLSSPTVEKHLIITVGNSAYLALAKGGLVDEHLLICSIDHYQCSLNQPVEVLQEIMHFKASLKEFYKRYNNIPVFFERNYKTSHMQIQAVPIPENATKELSTLFKEIGKAHGIRLQEMEPNIRYDQVFPINVPYLVIELPNSSTLFTLIEEKNRFPINFARDVLAMEPILNMSNRAEWRDCILTKEQETVLVERIRCEFEPYVNAYN